MVHPRVPVAGDDRAAQVAGLPIWGAVGLAACVAVPGRTGATGRSQPVSLASIQAEGCFGQELPAAPSAALEDVWVLDLVCVATTLVGLSSGDQFADARRIGLLPANGGGGVLRPVFGIGVIPVFVVYGTACPAKGPEAVRRARKLSEGRMRLDRDAARADLLGDALGGELVVEDGSCFAVGKRVRHWISSSVRWAACGTACQQGGGCGDSAAGGGSAGLAGFGLGQQVEQDGP